MQIPAPVAVRQEGGLPYKWIVACVVIFGIFMSILDSTIVNIATPRLQTAFGTSLNNVQWVLTGYTLAQGVATPLTAYFSNRVGLKRFYLISLACFTLGSALCGLAWSLPVLIIFRVFQGLTGAFLTPLAITLLYQEFPPNERGTALGVLGIPILLAPALGPTVGGYIVTFADWPLVFFINVPIGILGLVLAFFLLHNGQAETRSEFDLFGFLFSASGLALLLYGLSDASTDGWGSAKVLSCLIAGIILLAIFTYVELSRIRQERQPLLDLRVFGYRSFTTSSLASTMVTFALFGGLFLVPLYLQVLRGLSAYEAGLLLLPQALASMVAVVLGGRLVDRFGVRAIVIPGLIILCIALYLFTKINVYIPLGEFQILLILRGFALGLCFQPLLVSALSEIPPHRLAQGSAMSTALRFISSSLGVAVIATLVQSNTKTHYAHLSENVTATSRLGQLIPRLQALFMSHGGSPLASYTAALREVQGLLERQSYVLAMQDAFWLSLILASIAIIATFLIGGRKKIVPAPDLSMLSQEEREEAERAREEAMMGG